MKLLVVSLAVLGFVTTLQADKIITCYYGSWAVYRPGDGKFDVEQINPMLCTHAIFGFAGLGFDNTIKVLDSWNEVDKEAYKRFNALRNINPNLKTLIAVGGWNEGSEKYSKMASDGAQRKIFIDSVLAFLELYGFNGLDMDWEYPNQRGGAAEDKANYVTLLQELRAALNPKGYLLTAAMGVGKNTVDLSYDLPAISEALDFLHLMAYDLHGPWETHTGHHSMLYGLEGETGDDATLNVDWSVNYFISLGAPLDKLVLGMPLYGKSWSLSDATQNGIGAPTSGPGQAGPFTREGGTLGYNEICVNVQNGGWTVTKVSDGQNPYAVNGNQWVGYDDVDSIKIKAQYVLDKGLAGAMVWSIETDDFKGACHGVENPLLRTINEVINGGVNTPDPNQTTTTGASTESTTSGATTPTTSRTTATPPPPDGVCTQQGYVRDPVDCAKFYYCQPNGSGWLVYTYSCAPGLAYNPDIGGCDYADNVDCSK